MPPLTVRPLLPHDAEAAAPLIAARHARLRAQHPALPERFAVAEPCAAALRAQLAEPLAAGAAAERDGRLVGVLVGVRVLFAPDAFFAQYEETHTVTMPAAGHAVAEDEDAAAVYNALYAFLAPPWIDGGSFGHRISLLDGDAAAAEAWQLLGFGMATSFAARDTRPLDAPSPRADLDVRAATGEDRAVVSHFADLTARWHREAPMFWPYLADDVATAVHDFERRTLADPANATLLAYDGDRPIAMHMLLADGFGPSLAQPDHSVYLYEGITEPDARGAGAGAALLERSLAWARERDAAWCTLHFATANPSGRPFWLKHGFRPLEHTWARHVDERVAWARPRDAAAEGNR